MWPYCNERLLGNRELQKKIILSKCVVVIIGMDSYIYNFEQPMSASGKDDDGYNHHALAALVIQLERVSLYVLRVSV